MKNLPLAVHLLQPLVLAELLAETVRNTVRGDLVAAAVQRLYLTVVGPFMTHIESTDQRASGFLEKKSKISFEQSSDSARLSGR